MIVRIPEVLFDVEVLEVDRTVNQTYGLTYPKQVAAALVPPGFHGVYYRGYRAAVYLSATYQLGTGQLPVQAPDECAVGFLQAGHRRQDPGRAEDTGSQ